MQRYTIKPRDNWQQKVEEIGFEFHTLEETYWDESAYYSFPMREIELIEKATSELWDRCLEAVQYVIDQKLYAQFHIPQWFIPHIEKSWNDDAPAIYGRFDFSFDGNSLKLLEFNADTPTSLFEGSIVQWYWLQDVYPKADQFNSIHEKLVDTWKYLADYLHPAPLYLSCVRDSLEDYTTTQYMRDCAIQAGLDARFIYMDEIGWDDGRREFVDLDEDVMLNIFKLYPYEWLVNETFGPHLKEAESFWIEPSWKMILSNKAILPILWKLFPDCPYLLPAFFEQNGLTSYVKKPILSREGANIELVRDFYTVEHTGGEYGEEGFIYQQLCELPNFNGNYPVIGSWVIGQEPAGIGIRESNNLITDNKSRFVPHLIL
ncbi:MAG: glutathionylspermidine synthase family protein [Bacteroidetes bacterium]|nr:glutathionylspermidine synthase family protein [Bacteroidota bacterium]